MLADVAAHEALTDPDGKVQDGRSMLDTNPVALLLRGRRFYVVDAGGDVLLRYRSRDVETSAAFPVVRVPGPGCALFPMAAVPMAAAVGPDGAV